jgi:hypothetical protein
MRSLKVAVMTAICVVGLATMLSARQNQYGVAHTESQF